MESQLSSFSTCCLILRSAIGGGSPTLNHSFIIFLDNEFTPRGGETKRRWHPTSKTSALNSTFQKEHKNKRWKKFAFLNFNICCVIKFSSNKLKPPVHTIILFWWRLRFPCEASWPELATLIRSLLQKVKKTNSRIHFLNDAVLTLSDSVLNMYLVIWSPLTITPTCHVWDRSERRRRDRVQAILTEGDNDKITAQSYNGWYLRLERNRWTLSDYFFLKKILHAHCAECDCLIWVYNVLWWHSLGNLPWTWDFEIILP